MSVIAVVVIFALFNQVYEFVNSIIIEVYYRAMLS